ncbi:MAG: hypothetical protein NTZ33_15435 [Bacteroidetes bacterium]|nr:hypothetical protein [Bacteroidota bacterium]
MKFISERYHAEMAIDHYRSARQTHSEGIAYKHLIENMSFLNDDFSDKLSHFYTSLERYNLRNGGIKDDVKKLKKFAVSTNLYKTTYHTIDPLNYNLILENEDN